MPFGFLKNLKNPLRRESSVPPSTVPAVGAYGKIPKAGDFVRVGGKATPAFETWLEAGVGWGEKRHAAEWPNVWANGPIHAFLYRAPPAAKEPDVLAGVIKPSNDSVGRRFPLAVFARTAGESFLPSPHLAPLVLGDFLEASVGIAAEAAEADGAPALQERVARHFPPDLRADTAAREYDTWARTTLIRVAWQSIYGDPDSSEPLAALRAIRETLEPFHEQENLTTPLSLRLPLGAGGIATAAFWIDVIRRIARWNVTIPTVFWSFDGRTGAILVQLGTAPPSSLAELWSPDPNSDHVYDLTRPTIDHRTRLLSDLPRALAAKLDRGDTLVGDLLALL